MHHTAPRFNEPDELREHVLNGRDLEGRIVEGIALREVLTEESPTKEHIVRNAIIKNFSIEENPGTKVPFPHSITFKECTFVDHAEFFKCTFGGNVSFESCRFEADLAIKSCSFKMELAVGNVLFGGRFLLDGVRLPSPPSIHGASFSREMQIVNINVEDGNECAPRDWQISDCVFASRAKVEEFPNLWRPIFFGCRFETGSVAHVRWKTLPVDAEFDGCLLDGRLLLKCDDDPKAKTPFERENGASVTIGGCTVAGEVDLSELRIRRFRMPRTSMAGGRIWIGRPGISSRFEWRRHLFPFPRIAAADRQGTLCDEHQVGGGSGPVRAVDLRNIATQYEQLRNGLKTLPFTDWEEDFCHYKCMDFRRRFRIARLGLASGRSDSTIEDYEASTGRRHFLTAIGSLLGLLVLLVAGLIVFKAKWLVAPVAIFISGGWTVWLYHYSRQHHFTLAEVIRELVDLVILKWLLAYGTHVRRILGWAIACMLAFAVLVYWPIVVWGEYLPEGFAGILTPDGCCIGRDVPEQCGQAPADSAQKPEAVSAPVLLGRVVYFSAVTFTTLGYGDYHPVGWVKAIAAAEAFLGALTIALVTVVFARRFIR